MVKKVLTAVDGSLHSRKSLEFALSLASAHDTKLYIVHVVPERKIPEAFVHFAEEEHPSESPEFVYLKKVGNKIVE